MNNKNTQIKNKMIRTHPKTDRDKLIGLRRFIWETWPGAGVSVEPFMVFTKGEDTFQYWAMNGLTKEVVEEFGTHAADLVIIHGKMIAFELDGPIHDIKTEKTAKRNKRYELNNIPYIVINEEELKLKLGVKKLSQDNINEEFKERFDKL